MLKSIKEVTNIGVFADFKRGASIRLGKLNLIYGLNGYGKTTLSAILESLAKNDSSIIISRKTIPATSGIQKVTLSVQEGENNKEKDLVFQNGCWENNSISTCIEIFGTEFIHKNVFTGSTIERKNKENFTRFILGEQDVLLAKKIAEKKQELGNMRKKLKNEMPWYLTSKDQTERNKFLALPIKGLSKENIEVELSQKRNSLETLKEPEKVLDLKVPSKLEIPDNVILKAITELNTLFIEDNIRINEESVKKLDEHLLKNCAEKDEVKNWVKTGLFYHKSHHNMNCPFCGQNLENARDLIELYDSYFNSVYNKFVERLLGELDNNRRIIQDTIFSQKSNLQTIFSVIKRYKDFIKTERFQSLLLELEKDINSIQEESLNSEKNELLHHVETRISAKVKCPYKKVEQLFYSAFNANVTKYYNILNCSKQNIEALIEEINICRNQYKDSSVTEREITRISETIKELEDKNRRIDLDKDCLHYKEIEEKISSLEKEIKLLNNTLEENQSNYLDRFFDKINTIFTKLGGRNFKLEKDITLRGHLPVYSLKVKFYGVDISSEQLETLFSESDRRSLALSIFLAKLSLKADPEKAKTIIILDDPVTSFDDNRVTNSINLFKEYLTETSQTIILTHYFNFIKRFCEITKPNQLPYKIIELKLDEKTSSLSETDVESFNKSEYEKIFLKIYRYINRAHTDCIKTDLRRFLECLYLPTIFAKKINDDSVDCDSLEKMIDGIFNHDSDSVIRSKFHQFRTDLNPESHFFTSNNAEDVRSYAEDMINYLYSLKIDTDYPLQALNSQGVLLPSEE